MLTEEEALAVAPDGCSLNTALRWSTVSSYSLWMSKGIFLDSGADEV